MAGLFGLFGGKTKYVDEPDTNTSQDSDNKEAFFLKPDDAKTLGNVEFMRKPNIIKHTFAKRPGGKHVETVKEISSMKATKVESNGLKPMKPTESKVEASPETSVNTERRSSDKTMDMFRQMARDIKK
ncbi:hypothetical protein [Aphanothece sacrum]|uniref:Uncharacterized protein n=1 Tax=Aphanothece sacrum FPU1 TaxID=1920663 RepID=A0A401IMU4_APHSA|nr:hypothetical protein [Aphanothece sacrum]GBF82562.1 hypothetical protein AsFPU1_3992 [Aphanothece sacrum FPU1]GBF84696.1 hypothetical protein AsFPU3_1750 [Aphanothece sacrum FPU3]